MRRHRSRWHRLGTLSPSRLHDNLYRRRPCTSRLSSGSRIHLRTDSPGRLRLQGTRVSKHWRIPCRNSFKNRMEMMNSYCKHHLHILCVINCFQIEQVLFIMNEQQNHERKLAETHIITYHRPSSRKRHCNREQV